MFLLPFPVHGLDKALGLEPTRISMAGFMYMVVLDLHLQFL